MTRRGYLASLAAGAGAQRDSQLRPPQRLYHYEPPSTGVVADAAPTPPRGTVAARPVGMAGERVPSAPAMPAAARAAADRVEPVRAAQAPPAQATPREPHDQRAALPPPVRPAAPTVIAHGSDALRSSGASHGPDTSRGPGTSRGSDSSRGSESTAAARAGSAAAITEGRLRERRAGPVHAARPVAARAAAGQRPVGAGQTPAGVLTPAPLPAPSGPRHETAGGGEPDSAADVRRHPRASPGVARGTNSSPRLHIGTIEVTVLPPPQPPPQQPLFASRPARGAATAARTATAPHVAGSPWFGLAQR